MANKSSASSSARASFFMRSRSSSVISRSCSYTDAYASAGARRADVVVAPATRCFLNVLKFTPRKGDDGVVVVVAAPAPASRTTNSPYTNSASPIVGSRVFRFNRACVSSPISSTITRRTAPSYASGSVALPSSSVDASASSPDVAVARTRVAPFPSTTSRPAHTSTSASDDTPSSTRTHAPALASTRVAASTTTRVPCVDPRSRTSNAPARASTRNSACRLDTVASPSPTHSSHAV
mmetsp:Transcript_6460/g.21796  ORF Transcript_6460/g.21796 Transcript_6460/m.21796 type:complete len:237 (+) Transcript_6460:1097-1807(+)